MAQQLFISSSKFSAPVMTLDSKAKMCRNAYAIRNAVAIFATFYLTRSLQERCFVCDKFYLSHKSEYASSCRIIIGQFSSSTRANIRKNIPV